MGHPVQGSLPNANLGFVDPEDIEYDYSRCDSDRRHILNLTMGVETPRFDHAIARRIESGWRISGVYRASSGSPLTVTVTTDPARTGITNQRADALRDSPYGDRSIDNYLAPAAFAQPTVGGHGGQRRNWFSGPGMQTFDVAVVRNFRFGGGHMVQVRAEAFNAFNWTQLNNPVTNLNSNLFGRLLAPAIRASYNSP